MHSSPTRDKAPGSFQYACLTGDYATIPLTCYSSGMSPLYNCPITSLTYDIMYPPLVPLSPPRHTAKIRHPKPENTRDIIHAIRTLSFSCADYPAPHQVSPLNRLFHVTKGTGTLSSQNIVQKFIDHAHTVCSTCLSQVRNSQPPSVSSFPCLGIASLRQLRLTQFFRHNNSTNEQTPHGTCDTLPDVTVKDISASATSGPTHDQHPPTPDLHEQSTTSTPVDHAPVPVTSESNQTAQDINCASEHFASVDFAFDVTDSDATKLISFFPATHDILPLQQSFPQVPYHPNALWVTEHIHIESHRDIHHLRCILATAKCVYIYTDGSLPSTDRADQGPAFSLVVFFERQDGSFAIAGFLSAQLRFCGPLFQVDYSDSTLTEFAGIIFARLWIAITAPACPTHIFSDSLIAINILCNYHNPGKYRPLANLAHSVGNYISSSVQHCDTHTLSHVKGHSDHPWNELADSLAKATATAEFLPVPFCTDLIRCIKDSVFNAWLHIAHASTDLIAYPPVVQHEFHATSVLTHTDSLFTYHLTPQQQLQQASPHQDKTPLVFRSATHNVMSATDKSTPDTLAFDSTNINLLSQQYAHHFLHLIGQQESRLPAKKRLSALYIIIGSGTNPRHGLGCSLWYSRFLPYYQLNGKTFCFHMKHFFVVYDPRLLVVDVDAPFLRMRTISAHAPIAKDHDAREAFFKLLFKYVQYPNRIMLFIDANSRPEDAISTGKSGANAYLRAACKQFDEFLEKSKLCTTHLIPRFAPLTKDTWTSHKTGMQHTIDYVATKIEDIHMVERASVLPSIDNGHMLQDHVPSAATFVFHAGPDHFRPHCNRVRVTKSQIQDPSNQAAFISALSTIPTVPWDTPLDKHYTQIAAQVFQAIQDSFPPPKLTARRPHITVDTLHMSAESRSLKQQIRFLRTSLVADTLSDAHKHAVSEALKHCRQLLLLLCKGICKQARRDLSQYIVNVASKLDQAFFRNQPDEAWKVIKRLIGTAPGNKYSTDRTLPLMYDDQSVPVTTHVRKLEVVFDHFAKLERADKMSEQQLLQRCSKVGPTTVDYVPSIHNIMSPFDFGSRISRQSRGHKAPGFDCSTPELAAIAPEQYIRIFHPLHVKMAVTSTEPLQLKGSINAAVPKKGKVSHTCNDVRAITLRNHLLKAHHGYLRSLAYPLLHSALHVAQTGGAKGRGTDISNALIRWNLFHQKCVKKSAVTFLCDVTAAFYSMIRQLVLPVSYHIDDLDDIIDQIGIPEPFVEPLKILMTDASTLERLIPDKHLLAMLSESQRLPWFQVQGFPRIACTKTGSGPGGPLADLLYNVAMLPAINEIDSLLVEKDFCFQFPPTTNLFTSVGQLAQGRQAHNNATVIAFVDDLSGSAPLDIRTCPDFETFTDRVSNFIAIFVQTLHKRGMILNCLPGKCAIMISLSGQNSKAAKQWVARLEGYLTVMQCRFQLVVAYKLLGGTIEALGSLGPELHNRQLAVTQISAPFHRYISTKVELPLAHSVTLVNSMVVSSLLFNAHTWCDVTNAQLHQINARLATTYGSCIPYKVMYAGTNGKFRRISDRQVFSITSMPDAYRQLRYRRLLFLPRLLKAAPDSLLAILDATTHQPGSFAFTVMHDLQWLGQHSSAIVSMETPPTTLYQWLNYCSSISWKSTLRSAYYNDNRLYLDDLAHICMLQDIIKLHEKVGLSPPSFIVRTLADKLRNEIDQPEESSDPPDPLISHAGDTNVSTMHGQELSSVSTQHGGEDTVPTTVRPVQPFSVTALQPKYNGVSTTVRPDIVSHVSVRDPTTTSTPPATQSGEDTGTTTVRPAHAVSFSSNTTGVEAEPPPPKLYVRRHKTICASYKACSTCPQGDVADTTTARHEHVSVSSATHPHIHTPATQHGEDAVLTTFRPDVSTGYATTQERGTMLPTTARPEHASSSSASQPPALLPSTQHGGNAGNTTVRLAQEPDAANFLCYECGQLFSTKKAWHNHMRLTHKKTLPQGTWSMGTRVRFVLSFFPASPVYTSIWSRTPGPAWQLGILWASG